MKDPCGPRVILEAWSAFLAVGAIPATGLFRK